MGKKYQMNRKQAKELLPALTHFANGGNLWYRLNAINEWYKQEVLYITDTKYIQNIIEDKHFESRKAFALGEEIETRYPEGEWYIALTPWFDNFKEYRPKPKEPTYEWQYNSYNKMSESWTLTEKFFPDEPNCNRWIKFEPSKRIKKD